MSGGCFGSSGSPSTSTSGPEVDSTPVGGVVKPCEKRNFIIILGGPGKYNPKDPDHDSYWGNYFVAAQHVFGVPGLSQFSPETALLDGECVHWLVYGSAYSARWPSDKGSKIKFQEEHAAKYPAGYLSRIQQYVGELNTKHAAGRHKYVLIDSYKDVWETLHKLPDGSLTRMYYFGHGGPKAFYMRWARDFSRPDISGDTTSEEQIHYDKIDAYKSWLATKAKPADGQISKFYACTSRDWAKKWQSATGLKSEGAINKITFKNIRADSTLRGLETDGGPLWGPAN